MGKIHVGFEIDEFDLVDFLVKKHTRMHVAMPGMEKQTRQQRQIAGQLPALLTARGQKATKGKHDGGIAMARLFVTRPSLLTTGEMREAYKKIGMIPTSYSARLTQFKKDGYVGSKKQGEWYATPKGLEYFRNMEIGK